RAGFQSYLILSRRQCNSSLVSHVPREAIDAGGFRDSRCWYRTSCWRDIGIGFRSLNAATTTWCRRFAVVRVEHRALRVENLDHDSVSRHGWQVVLNHWSKHGWTDARAISITRLE